ncbi:MAG: cyclic nucleotide-binding domain-containing protein, partial [Alphaproteobacteria bacterium]|nr:cyclic nucleotide-binding domain-containing protein [Alphaproteobacteria bacterium]
MAKFSIDNLATVRLLEGLEESDLQDLEQRGRWRRYVAEEQILDRDSETREVFFVVEGSVDVINFSLSGREVAYGQVRAGGYFGEMAAIDGRRRSANIVANQDSLVFIVPSDAFMDILNTHVSAAMVVLRRLAHIVRTADDRIMDLSTL